jgi:hypothetical protein
MMFGQGGGSGGRGTGSRRGQVGGAGRMGGTRAGAGPGGYCVCPACGHRVVHQVGQPCFRVNCPKCGTRMARE